MVQVRTLKAVGLRLAPLALALSLGAPALAQTTSAPVNDRPNPYRTILSWEQLPEGRRMGASAAVAIDRDGKSVWVAERCGANGCTGSDLPMVLKFDSNGRLLRSFGSGVLVRPHGIDIDRDGNVWVTDMGVEPTAGKGAVVIKFSPEGKVLMTIGTPGVEGGDSTHLMQPCDVLVAPNGDIFISDSHAGAAPGANARILKFSSTGKFIKSFGKLGTGPGELNTPHAMAMDSAGRLFVADRGNNRIQIFDQDGKSLAIWTQFSRPSGLYIRNDVIYVTDSETNIGNHPGGWRRGVRVGSAKTGEVRYFIPWLPESLPDAPPSGMEGVAADADGAIYGSNVYLREFFAGGPWGEIRKFVKPK